MVYDSFWNWRALGSASLVLKGSRSKPTRLRPKSRAQLDRERESRARRAAKILGRPYVSRAQHIAWKRRGLHRLQNAILDTSPRPQPPLWG
jgi:hypothetical protein